ncbi:MAG TPA: pyridoxamine 5'-phosphate oxidase family protein [Candidatus Binatia bacterium]|nr:pyridoxamine 5'-phosphate oxidase family protein [Candidatus Binatia bacterium]
MKTAESADDVAALQKLLESSTGLATPALADSVAWEPRRMTAAELIDFWSRIRLVAMATVGPAGQPHIAPVHAELRGSELSVLVYEDAVRRRDLAANPRVAFTAWDSDGAVVILYGRAAEKPGSVREARPSQAGRPRKVVEMVVRLTRVYAMSARKVCSAAS